MKIEKTTVIELSKSDLFQLLFEKKLITKDQKISKVSYNSSSENLTISFIETTTLQKKEKVEEVKTSQKNQSETDEILDKEITDFDFSVRVMNILKSYDVRTIRDLVGYRKRELLKFRLMGKVTLNEIMDFLTKNGLELETPEV